MPNVVNVQFRGRGKSYFFDPGELTLRAGDRVVVETSKGLELGECVEGPREVPQEKVVQPLRGVVRLASPEDLRTAEANRKKEENAFRICEERIRAHGLDMKLVDVEYAFEGGKILFFFTSDGRVDFRELVKDLAGLFHTRIELRQIGVRDGAKLLGGLGMCGRPFCCSTFLEEFQPVSIKMAKTQNLSLNPSKISGTCGRLMCCLKYEQEAYEHLIKTLPKAESPVDTPKGKGTVAEVNLLRRTVKVRLADPTETSLQTWSVDRLGYTLNGEYVEPKPEEKAPVRSELPDLSLYAGESSRLGDRVAEALRGEQEGERKSGHGRNRKNRHGKSRPAEPGAEARSPEPGAEGKPKAEGKPERPQEQRKKGPRPEGAEKKADPKGHQPPRGQGGKGQPQQKNQPQKNPQQPKSAAPKSEGTPEGGAKKPNRRRYFHRGGKKPGGGSAGTSNS